MTPLHPRRLRLGLWLAAGALVIAAAGMRPWLMHSRAVRDAMTADTLDESDLTGDALQALSPNEAERLWSTGRLGHRRALMQQWIAKREGGFPKDHETEWLRVGSRWILEGSCDPDLELRTRALGALREVTSPGAARVVRAQFEDADPEIRRLGLQTLRLRGGTNQIGWVLPRLHDVDPTIALAADAVLRHWTGLDSGLRLSRILPSSSTLIVPELGESDRTALQEAEALWNQRFRDTNPVVPWVSAPPRKLPMDPFELEDLQGRVVASSRFRGKRVLLNFWATWCPGCLAEFPVLDALQRRHPNDLVVLGLNLDSPNGTEAADGPVSEGVLRDLRKTVGAVAARHRIGFPVLLDPERRVARRVNGGELPTQVLLDREGWVRRRFVGGRSLEAWEALLADADRPGVSGAGGHEAGEPVGSRPTR